MLKDSSLINFYIAILVVIPGFLWLVGRGFHGYIGAKRPQEWSIEMPAHFRTVLATPGPAQASACAGHSDSAHPK